MNASARAPWARDGLDSTGSLLHGARSRRLSGRTAVALGFILALLLSLWQSGLLAPDSQLINLRGWPQLSRFLRAAFRPELSPDFLWITLHAAGQTLAFAVLGTALSLFLGLLLGVLSSELWWQSVAPAAWWWPWAGIRTVLAFPRAIHEVIWALLLINILGLDPLTAVLAIGIPFGAIVAKVYAEILDETPRAPLLALRAAGSPPLPALAYGLFPQALPDLVGYAFYRFECSIRAAAVLGMVGAGGLGYELLLSTKSLKFGEMWTLIYALTLLGGSVDLWSGRVRRRLAPGRATQIDDGCGCFVDAAGQVREILPRRDRLVGASLVLTAGLVPFSWWLVELRPGQLFGERALAGLRALASQSWPPRLPAGGLAELLSLSSQTLAMSVLAMSIAAGLGLLLAWPATAGGLSAISDAGEARWGPGSPSGQGSRSGPGSPSGQGSRWGPGSRLGPASRAPRASGGSRRRARWLRRLRWASARFFLLIVRAVPPPIWALITVWVIFPGVLPGALALAAYTTGILGRLLADVLENADPRPARALAVLGARGPAILAYASLPACLPRYASYVLYRWEVCIRTTVVVGLVGAGGLGQLMRQQVAGFDYRGLTSSLACFVVLTVLVDGVSARVRRVLR